MPLPTSLLLQVRLLSCKQPWLQILCTTLQYGCRGVYPKLAGVGSQLVQALSSKGGEQAVDMSLACMCETIDALGMTGFNKAYHNVQAFKDGQAPEMLTVSLALPCSASPRLASPRRALPCLALPLLEQRNKQKSLKPSYLYKQTSCLQLGFRSVPCLCLKCSSTKAGVQRVERVTAVIPVNCTHMLFRLICLANSLSPWVTISTHVSPCQRVCHRVSPCVTTCRDVSSCVTMVDYCL